MLALKLILTPLFIGMASLAGRRWGPVVSGWLVGLPLTSAPVTLFLAFEQGTTFASRVAQGTLMGILSQAAAFSAALLAALLIQACALWLMRRQTASSL